jgi:hypothetical protein
MHMTRSFGKTIADGRNVLTDEQISRFAPSVFATQAHESRSARFAYIPTTQVLAAMRAEGFQPMKVAQGRSRIEGKAEYTKHMIRFRHASQNHGSLKLGQTFPEVVLINSHDGTSAYKLMSGLFRLVCLNGMVVREGIGSDFRVPHVGDVVGKVIEGSYKVIDESTRSLEAAEAWADIRLGRDEQMFFAEAAHTIRFADAEGNVETAIKPAQLLGQRRAADASNDLWTTFNRVQENAVKGGLTAMGRDANNRLRRTTTREVKNIDGDVKLNRALWVLAERMASLKGVAAAA